MTPQAKRIAHILDMNLAEAPTRELILYGGRVAYERKVVRERRVAKRLAKSNRAEEMTQ